MAQATNPKIEELRARIKTDPKSRLFFPLAEELRKMGALDEAEEALRAGLEQHPTYLSAWVSLGRVLRERGNSQGVIDVLTKALQIDPGNVVAARILADTYLETDQKVEAIKKYKLVHALLPQDQDVDALIERLDAELNPPEPSPRPELSEDAPLASIEREELSSSESPHSDGSPEGPVSGEAVASEDGLPADTAAPATFPQGIEYVPPAAAPAPADFTSGAKTPDFEPAVTPDVPIPEEPGFSHPSQFDETAPLRYDSHAFAIEQPAGMHITGPQDDVADGTMRIEPATDSAFSWAAEAAPESSVGAMPVAERSDDLFSPIGETQGSWPEVPAAAADNRESLAGQVADPIEVPTEEPSPPFDSQPAHMAHRVEEPSLRTAEPSEHPADDVTNTITMGDLYARQGLVDDAREIYSRVLERDPGNESIRARLDDLQQQPAPAQPASAAAAKSARLEAWLSKVKRGSRSV
jgi:tetratricopeptide (TPR) repeat protein